jgi:hypothetical protein
MELRWIPVNMPLVYDAEELKTYFGKLKIQ